MTTNTKVYNKKLTDRMRCNIAAIIANQASAEMVPAVDVTNDLEKAKDALWGAVIRHCVKPYQSKIKALPECLWGPLTSATLEVKLPGSEEMRELADRVNRSYKHSPNFATVGTALSLGGSSHREDAEKLVWARDNTLWIYDPSLYDPVASLRYRGDYDPDRIQKDADDFWGEKEGRYNTFASFASGKGLEDCRAKAKVVAGLLVQDTFRSRYADLAKQALVNDLYKQLQKAGRVQHVLDTWPEARKEILHATYPEDALTGDGMDTPLRAIIQRNVQVALAAPSPDKKSTDGKVRKMSQKAAHDDSAITIDA